MAIAQEEIFGPVLVVIGYDDDDDAVRIANDSPYGLSGTITGGDLERAKAVARRIRTGTLGINGGLWYGADAPFGGYKGSGVGRQCGIEGLGDVHRDEDGRLAGAGCDRGLGAELDRGTRRDRAAGGHPRHRGGQLDVHPVGRLGAGRLGRRGHQGRAAHRRPPAAV